jgi:hypothetical protein
MQHGRRDDDEAGVPAGHLIKLHGGQTAKIAAISLRYAFVPPVVSKVRQLSLS